MKIENLFLVQNSTSKINTIECPSEQIAFRLHSKWYLLWIARSFMLLITFFIFLGMIKVSESFLVSVEFILKKKKNFKKEMIIYRDETFMIYLFKTLSSCSFQICIPLIEIVLHNNHDFVDFGTYFVTVNMIQIF
jgi:hypothetical protein